MQFYLAQLLQYSEAEVPIDSTSLRMELNEFKKRHEKFETIRTTGEEKIKNTETGGIECV
jgi:hypothetical protein